MRRRGGVKPRHNLIRAEMDRLRTELQPIYEGVHTTSGSKRLLKSQANLVASGDLVRHGQASLLRRLIQPWQIRSLGYYDLLGEIKYASQFYARALAPLKLFAAERDDEGEPVPTKDADVIDALDRIRDPGGGGRSGLLADYGRLMFLTGEALLFVSKNGDSGLEQWEMLSTDELRLLDGNYTRFRAPSLTATMFRPAPDDAYEPVTDDEAVAYRLWKRHPRFSALPDSTMMGVLDLCEELVLLTQAVRARARSRLANSGILFVDDRVTTQPQEAVPDEDPQEDAFLADLTESMTRPIVDEGTASAVVPLVARVHVPDGMKLSDLVYHLQVIDPMQLYPETGLRMECIRRIAIGLDMPPEILLGLDNVNHWTAWILDETIWKAHIQPIANALVEDLTSAYLGPYLRDVKHRQDWDKFLVWYDPADILVHPDRSSDAKDLHGKGVIGDDALLRETGFSVKDKPSKEELARALGIATRDSSLAWDMTPSPRGGAVETAPGEIADAAGGDGATSGSEVKPGPPPAGPPQAAQPPAGPPSQTASILEAQIVGGQIAALVEGAASVGLLRAREAAGAKIRTACRRDEEMLALIDGTPARDVAAKLGPGRVRQILGGPKEAELVASAAPLIEDALRQFGIDDPEARSAVAQTVQRHAARTLYDDKPCLPPSFGAYVAGVLTNGKR